MTSTLFVAIKDEAQQIQGLYRAWRSDYREDINNGTIKILQLAIDMTGYHYVLTLEDVTNIENIQIAVCEKIIKSNYHDPGIFGQPTVMKRLSKLLELLIVHDYEELLLNNIWLNSFVRILVAFCESNNDVCKMVAGYLSMLVLRNLDYVRKQLYKRQEAEQLDESETLSELEMQRKYVYKVTKVMLQNIEHSCGYTPTLPVITELFCQMLEAQPMVYIIDNCMLNLLSTFLQHRHCKMFQTVAACFRNLLSADIQEEVVVSKVANFFMESAGERFLQSMFKYTSSQKIAMEVVMSIQRLNCGKAIFDEPLIEKLRNHMFHKDETIRGYAIDFHVCSLSNPDERDNNRNIDILQHILKLYVQFDHSSHALSELITHLWKLDFFDDWHMLFNLLKKEAGRNDNHFVVLSVVQVINTCFDLLTNDLQQQTSEQSTLISLLKSFMLNFPSGLKMCINNDYAYIALLQSANAGYNNRIKQFNVNMSQYYGELFIIFDNVLQSGSNFHMISKTLLVISGYCNLIQNVEQMCTGLLEQHINKFFETRAKFNSRNIGKCHELTEQYAVSVTRLAAFLEVIPRVDGNLYRLLSIVLNDSCLLERMNMSNFQASAFYRLYKCLFYVLVNGIKGNTTEECLAESIGAFRQTERRLKKRLLELLRVLTKQLQKYDESLDTCVHVFTSLCDLLLITQTEIANLNIPELMDMVYRVEPMLLQKMAKFLLNYVFSKQNDLHEAPIMKQKLLLAKYINLYHLHKSLPSITDTYYIVANYSIDSTFDMHLQSLIKVLYQVDQSQFYEIICRAAFQLLQVYKSESSVKNFFKKIKILSLSYLTADDEKEYNNLMGEMIKKILNHSMRIIMSDPESASESKRMLKLIEPLLSGVSLEQRLKMQHFLQGHSEYEHLTDVNRKAIDRFLNRLNPPNN